MEHLEFLLLQSENMTKQQAMFGLLFEEFPTYDEIVNGTPKLSLVFELSKAYAEGKTLLVARRGILTRRFAPFTKGLPPSRGLSPTKVETYRFPNLPRSILAMRLAKIIPCFNAGYYFCSP
jgi:hypothetical protein